MIGPGPSGDHLAVDHRIGIDIGPAGRPDIRLERRIGRGPLAVEGAGGRQHQRRVAELRHRLLLIEEVPDDVLDVTVVADVLGARPPGMSDRHVVGRVDVGKSKVGVPAVPRFLGIGIEPWFEIVDDEVELLLAGSRDLSFGIVTARGLGRDHAMVRALRRVDPHRDALLGRHRAPTTWHNSIQVAGSVESATKPMFSPLAFLK